MKFDSKNEVKQTVTKFFTPKKVAKVALPVMAAFAGTSSRIANASSVARSTRGGIAAYAINEKVDPNFGVNKIGQGGIEAKARQSAFSAFSNRAEGANNQDFLAHEITGAGGESSVVQKPGTNRALDFLKENGLLSPATPEKTELSGDIYGVVGRKSFAHESQFNHCHTSWGGTYNTNTTTLSETSCTTGWGGTWETASENPVVSSTSIQNKTATSFDVAVTMSEASTVYAVVIESSKTAPSSAQVEAGTDGSGSAATQALSGVAGNSVTLSFSGLDASKNYIVYIMGKDGDDNVTTSPAQVNPAYESGLISDVGTWKFPKTRVDSSGNIYLAHASTSQINFLEWNGAGFSSVTTITASDVSGRSNMGWGNEHRVDYELDSSGNIHVVFNASTDQWAVNNDPFYGVYNGTTWTITNIGETGYLGGEFDLFLDENDKAHISFNLTPDADKVMYATNESGSWVISTVMTSTNSGTDEIHDTYCVVDSSGDAHIFYRREDSQNFGQDNYYYTSSSDSFSTHTKILDGKTDTKQYRMANVYIDSSDKLHYAYDNSTDSESHYVTNESGSWVSSDITHTSHAELHVYDMAVENDVFYFANVSGSTYFINSYDGTDWVEGFDFTLSGWLNDRIVVSDTADRIMVVSENSSDWEIHYHTATVASYVTPPVSNNVPTITGLPASFSTDEDTAVDLNLSAVVLADVEDDSITLTLAVNSGVLASTDGDGVTSGVTVANSGTASMTLSGTAANINTYLDTTTVVQFTPTANANGSVTLSATPNDANGTGSAASGTITVDAINDDPTMSSLPTDITVTEDVASNIDLSSVTFSDIDSSASSVVLTLAASAGTLSASTGGGVTIGGSGTGTMTLTGTASNIDTYLNTSSNIQFTSASNSSGNDAATLTLTANDGGNTGTGGGSNVNLGTVNLDITAVDDSPSDISITASSINESNVGTGADVGTLSSTDVDSGSFTYSLISSGAADSGSCSADTNNGSFQINGTTLETSGVLSAGDYDICLQTSDGSTSFEESFTITVVDNIAPTVTISSLTTADSTPQLSGTVDDNSATISVTVNSASYAATNNANGTWTLADNTISALTHGTWEVVVTATDGASNVGSDVSSNELTVDIEAPAGHSVAIDQSLIDASNESAMSFTFSSAEVGASYSYSISDGSGSVSGSGTVSGSSQQISGIDVSGLNETTLTLSVVLTDTLGNAATAVTDTVLKQYNNTPVITEGATTAVTMSEDGSPTAFSLTLNATDGDADTLTWTIGSNGSNGTASVSGVGTSKAISYSPTANYFGADSFTVNVSDGLASDTITVNVTVESVNDTPAFSSTEVTSVNEDDSYSYSIVTTDVESDARSITATTKPSWLTFTDNSDGTATLTGTPTNSEVGDHSVLLTLSDGSDSATQSFTVSVANTNDAPLISGTPSTSVNEDSAYSFVPTASDVDSGDTLTFSVTNSPSWASFSTSTGELSGTPANDDVGSTSSIVISVSDGTETTSLASFNLTVVNTNDDPTISGTPATSVNEDDAYSFTPTSNDVDVGDTLTFSVSNLPSWANFNTGNGTLSGTPDNDDVGITEAIVIQVSDGTATTSLASFDLTVVNTNDAPLISGTPSTSVNEDSAYSFVPTASDVDSGDTLTFSVTNSPSWASFSTSTGELSGTPANGDVGSTSSIVISVSDGTETTSLASFNLTVVNTNDDPTISGTPATSVNEDDAYSFTPTSNDVDVGDTLTFSVSNLPSWASFSTSTGEISGTPANDDVGTTSNIVISVSDGTNSVSLASFDITVSNVNDAPIAVNDSDVTDEDVAVIISILDNDSDVDDTINAASVMVVSSPSNGSTSLNTGSGAITYTPNANFNGSDSFSYTVEDAEGGVSNTATVTLTVNAVNDAPTAVSDAVTTPEDNPLSIDVLANDSDIDSGDSVDSATLTIVSSPENATATVVSGEIYFEPDAHFNGSTSLTYTVDDGSGATSNIATVVVNVSGVNDVPLASNDSVTVNEDESVLISVLSNDSDIDGTIDPSTVSVVAAAANGVTSVSATGVITYTPASNYFGSDSFTYLVQDDVGGSSNTATVSVTVSSVNDAPATVSDSAMLMEDNSTNVNVLGNDSDVDGTLVATSVQVATAPSNGSVDVQANGSVTYTPDLNYFGGDSFTYRVQDNDGEWSAETTVNLSVESVNDAPLANDDSAVTDEDIAVIIDLLANDSDADGILDNSSITVVSAPENGTLQDNGDGTVTYSPDANYFGEDSFTYQVEDDSGESSNVADVTVVINAVNDAPVLSGAPGTSVNEDSSYSFSPTSSDVEGDELSFSVTNLPNWASFDSATGALTGTPDNDAVGVYGGIVIAAFDGTDTTTISAFEIEVVNTNDLPTLSGTPASSVNQDQGFSFTPVGADVDLADTLTYQINSLPSWATFDPQTGALTGTPNNAAVGSYTGIIISVTDGTEVVQLPAFDITVQNVNDAPVGVADVYSISEGGAVSGASVLDNDFDIDIDTLSVSLISGPASASAFTLASDGSISYQHDGSESIFDQFTYRVSDGALESDVVSVDIDIEPVNDAPTFVTESEVLTLAQGQSYSYDVGVSDPDSVANLQLINGPSWLTLSGSELTGVVPFDEPVGLASVVLRASDLEFTVDQDFDLNVTERETAVVSIVPTWTGLPSVVDEKLTLKVTINHQHGPTISDGNLLVVLTGENFDATMSACTDLGGGEFDCAVSLAASGSTSFNLKLTPHAEGDVIVNLDLMDFTGETVASKITDVSPSARTVNQGDNAFSLDNATAIVSIEMHADDNREIAAGTSLGDTVKLLDFEVGSDEATVLGEIENRGETKGLAVGDIDQDGTEDLLVVNSAGDATAVYYQRGELNFVEEAATVDLPFANQGVLQDLNSDGFPELILGGSGFNLYIYENISGVFSREPYVFTSKKSIKKFAKMKQKPDQAPMSGTLALASNDALVLIDFAIAAGKITKLSMSEIDTGGASNKIQVQRSSELNIPGITSIRLADLDNDGTEEILVSTHHKNNSFEKSGVTIVEVGDEGDMAEVRKVGNASADNVEVSDFNGDGLLDLVIANENNTYQFYHGDGSSTGFSLKDTIIYSESDLVLPGDVNDDGLSDLLIYVSEESQVDLYISSADGDLGSRADLNLSSRVETVSSTSYDIRQYFSIENSGMQTAEGVELTIDLPSHFNIVSLPDECVFDDSQILCDVGDLEAGQVASLAVVVNGEADVDDQVVQSRVTSAALEVAPENNKATVELDGLFQTTNASVKGGGSGGGFVHPWVLGLLLVLAFGGKRRGRKSIAACLLVLVVSVNAHSDSRIDVSNIYVEVGIGTAGSDWSESNFLRSLEGVTQNVEISQAKIDRAAWQLIAGYEMTDWFSAELGYQNWGDVDVDVVATTNNPDGLRQVLASEYPVSGSGPYLGGRFKHSFQNDLTAYVRLGVLMWSGDYDVQVGENSWSIESDGTELVTAIGVTKQVHEDLDLGVGYQMVSLNGEDQGWLSISLSYQFSR